MMLPSLAPEASASAISPQPPINTLLINSAPTIPALAKNGAEDRNRTGTIVANPGILSPVRLPVPPPRQNNGAGDGNRTHVASLEGWNSTIELHPHKIIWSWREESNSQPADYKSAALPVELRQRS